MTTRPPVPRASKFSTTRDVLRPRMLANERRGAEQPRLLAVGEQDDDVVRERRATGAQSPDRLEQRRGAGAVVPAAGPASTPS